MVKSHHDDTFGWRLVKQCNVMSLCITKPTEGERRDLRKSGDVYYDLISDLEYQVLANSLVWLLHSHHAVT